MKIGDGKILDLYSDGVREKARYMPTTHLNIALTTSGRLYRNVKDEYCITNIMKAMRNGKI